jgi:integrase
MTQPGEITKAEHIDWKYIPYVVKKLELDEKYKIALIVAFGCFFGIRLKHILQLKWIDLLNKESFEIEDKGSFRKIFIIDDIRHLIARVYKKLGAPPAEQLIFLNNTESKAISIQYVNKEVKKLFTKYEIPYQNLSSNSFLKTFCIKYLESKHFSTDAKKWISKTLGHATWSITAKFLGYNNDLHDRQNYNSFSMD